MKQLYFFLVFITLFSCQNNATDNESTLVKKGSSSQADSAEMEKHLSFATPIVMDSSDYMLIPIMSNLGKERSLYSKGKRYTSKYPKYWNILFYNTKTKKNKLLTTDKIRINRIHAPQQMDKPRLNSLKGKILLDLVKTTIMMGR